MTRWNLIIPVGALVGLIVGCPSGSDTDGGSDNSGGEGGAATTTTTTTTSAQGGGGAGGNGGTSSVGGAGGAGGSGGSGFMWPTCDTMPPTAANKSIPQVWTDDPATPTETWVSDAIVTAISRGACAANEACQIFLQDAVTYGDFASGAQHGIKMFVSAATSQYFTTVQVGDVVDVLAHAWRYNLDGQNELLLQVNLQLPGCAKTTGTATPTPIQGVTLDDLTEAAYETTHGPLFVQVDTVTGNPNAPTETFGIWPTGMFPIGGPTVSLSPFFLPNATFVGLTDGVNTDFTSVAGVFGLFVPSAISPKFVHIYPRSMTELVEP